MEDVKPEGDGGKRRHLESAAEGGASLLPFGKDSLCLGLISGAHPEAFPPSFFGTVHLPWFSQPWPAKAN